MNIRLVIKFKTIAINIIFTLSETLHIQANILKLICNKKLKTKNNIEYLSISHENKYFSQNKT
jgi:ABC-type oligopeptide transport system ATPase subunit